MLVMAQGLLQHSLGKIRLRPGQKQCSSRNASTVHLRGHDRGLRLRLRVAGGVLET